MAAPKQTAAAFVQHKQELMFTHLICGSYSRVLALLLASCQDVAHFLATLPNEISMPKDDSRVEKRRVGLGPDSIEKIWLEFWIEKWPQIPF